MSENVASLIDLLNAAKTPEEVHQVEEWIAEALGDDARAAIDDTDRAAGQSHNAAQVDRQQLRTAATQEIGPLPAVKEPNRRADCKFDLRLACVTYFGEACYKGLASYQLEMIRAFEAVLLHGGKKARAVRRGGLKSTIARIATAWAVLNGHRRYPVLVGATDDKSNEHRDNFFSMLATSPKLVEDFPELIPLLLKWKNPKKQLRLDGRILTVSAKDERGSIIFPDIRGTECDEARVSAYSMQATDVSGLNFVDHTGRTIRPDALLFDDVQTPKSAKSFAQTSERENAITTTFMGLAGLGETIAAIMVCTVREENDLTERFCDRKQHPDWDGQKFPVLLQEPNGKDSKALWSEYGKKLREGSTPEEGFALAADHYKRNRVAMDEGGVVAWEEDKEKGYESALQWCMTIQSLKPEYFRCELQQKGSAPPSEMPRLLPDQVVKRLSQVPFGIVPSSSSYLTALIDSSDHILWYMVVSFQKDFTSSIVEMGTYPDQAKSQFYKSDLRFTLEQQLPGASWEEAFVHAHNELDKYLLRPWFAQDGTVREIDLLLKDWSDGDHKPRIESQVLASSQRSRIKPSKGVTAKPGRQPVHAWGDPKKDRQDGRHWLERREQPPHVLFNANEFKSLALRRLQTVIGAPSCALLPGDDPNRLQLLAEHLTAEKPIRIVFDGTPGVIWEAIPNRDNDWWDCFVGCHVAASLLGCALPGERTHNPDDDRRTVSMPQNARPRSR